MNDGLPIADLRFPLSHQRECLSIDNRQSAIDNSTEGTL